MIWRLVGGGRATQETREQKLKKGLEYVEKLKSKGYEVSVQEFKTHLVIEKYELTGNRAKTDSVE